MMDGKIFVVLVFLMSGCFQHQFVPIIPKECEHKGYCENVPNYPHAYVNKIIEQLDNVGYLWTLSNISYSNTKNQLDRVKPLCKSRTEVVQILAAKHRSGKWYFVIDKFNLKFNVTICENTETACGTDTDIQINLDNDANRTQCLQRYIEDFRLTIDENGVLGELPLLTAVCCNCAVIANRRF